ncbi:ribosome biogenesis GTP-binding protein YihA/YsxC [Rickettsiales bacterium]|jgi:GTP-binding protein|nr:ribosome biogenesis GTP-binding protein YihA/YsxC [Rickettsiales bacterium]
MSSKNLSVADLKKRNFKFELSANSSNNWPKLILPEFAFIGRSNVGKSSLINSLTIQHNLAKTSKTPGRTQMINCFLYKDIFRLIDLPGYGYAKSPQHEIHKWANFTQEYLLYREKLKILFILIDSRHGLKAHDFDMINFCATNEINYQIILTKIDKTKKVDYLNKKDLIKENLTKELGYNNEIFVVSSIKNIGLDDIRSVIIKNV